jgi:phenylpyruvate tautomerase PptA (4-oxalocrotonate tautomerase family)
MPIVELHLVEGLHTPAQHAQVLRAISRRYADVLEAPLERVRAYLTLHRPEHWATAGEPGSPASAPYFTALVLQGRPVEQRRRLVESITDLLVDLLHVDRRLVRGRVVQVHPDDWAIGGVPASTARRSEIASRAGDGAPG